MTRLTRTLSFSRNGNFKTRALWVVSWIDTYPVNSRSCKKRLRTLRSSGGLSICLFSKFGLAADGRSAEISVTAFKDCLWNCLLFHLIVGFKFNVCTAVNGKRDLILSSTPKQKIHCWSDDTLSQPKPLIILANSRDLSDAKEMDLMLNPKNAYPLAAQCCTSLSEQSVLQSINTIAIRGMISTTAALTAHLWASPISSCVSSLSSP